MSQQDQVPTSQPSEQRVASSTPTHPAPTILMDSDPDPVETSRGISWGLCCGIFVLIIALSIGGIILAISYVIGGGNPYLMLHETEAISQYRYAIESGSGARMARHMLGQWTTQVIPEGTFPSPLAQAQDILTPGVYAWVALRTLHYDKVMTQSLMEGVRQVVILNAGLDTRAYRMVSELMRVGGTVFEVDARDINSEKRSRVARARLNKSGVVYVPMDLSRDALEDYLLEHPAYDEEEATLFIWEGSSMFTTPRVVDRILKLVGVSAPGSSVIFDVADKGITKPEWNGRCQGTGVSEFYRLAKQVGLVPKFGISPAKISSYLAKRALRVLGTWSSGDLRNAHPSKAVTVSSGPVLACHTIVHAKVMWPARLGKE